MQKSSIFCKVSKDCCFCINPAADQSRQHDSAAIQASWNTEDTSPFSFRSDGGQGFLQNGMQTACCCIKERTPYCKKYQIVGYTL